MGSTCSKNSTSAIENPTSKNPSADTADDDIDIEPFTYGDQSIATMDYDYTKAYVGTDNSVVSSAVGTMGENTRLTNNDQSSLLGGPGRAGLLGAGYDSESQLLDPGASLLKDEVIEIEAPSGKLGLMIDTPDDGAPVVHTVKDSSIIANQIRVGDKLIAIDDEDVTSMTSIEVSKIISKKNANPVRKLTVIRSSLP